MKIVKVGWTFLVLLLLQSIILISFNVAPALDSDNPKILRENIIQVIACVSLDVMVVFYGIFHWFRIYTVNETIKLMQLVTVLVFFVALCIVGWKVYLEFGWRIYKKIGADPHMRAMYRVYQVFLTFVKMDWAMAVILVFTAGVFFIRLDDYELYVNIMMIFVTLAWAMLQDESYTKAYIFYIFSFAEPVYIIYKSYLFLEYPDDPEFKGVPVALLIFAGVIGIILRIGLMSVYIMAYRNFRKGLADQLKLINTRAGETTGRKLTII